MKLIKILLFLTTIFIMNSCSEDNNSTSPQNGKLKIAALIDLTGHYAQFGVEAKQAMDLAILESKNIEIEYFDTQADLDVAGQQLDKVIKAGGYNVVVTLTSWVSSGLADKIKANNMLQMAIGSAVFDNPNIKNCVRLTGDVSEEIEYLTSILQSYNKIAIMYFNNSYGIGWNTALTASLNNKIAVSIPYIDTQEDFGNDLEKVKATNPDALVLISTKEAAKIVKQAANLNINTNIYGVRPTLTNQLLAEPASNGLMFTYPDLDESLEIFKAFKDKYGYRMSAFGAEGYDLVKSLDQLYTNDKKNDVLFTNFKNKAYNGALGKIKFDENGQADYNYVINVVTNGTWEKFTK
ncbi:MAG TPA: ABC transporter substrate-binding protein [Candidatus Kapabacteria bacterium]|nr:ABC transporter substrate-binding protein [Candidatus Kapabacteria bacterium]